MSRRIHLAVGSTLSRPGDVRANLQQIAEFARRAEQDGVDLLLTPELSACGYGPYPEVLASAEPAGDGPIFRELARLAAAHSTVICAGFAEAAGAQCHLAHYAVFPTGEFVVQRKHRVTLAERPLVPAVPLSGHPEGAPDPADPGQPLELCFNLLDIKGVRGAIAICADGGIDGLGEHLAARGVDLLLCPAGAGGRREDRVVTTDLQTEEGRQKYLTWLERVFFPGQAVTDCLRYRRAFAAVNQCGFDGRQMYHLGHGMIVTPMGEVPALIHGLPNLDRQRPLYTHAEVDVDDRLPPAPAPRSV